MREELKLCLRSPSFLVLEDASRCLLADAVFGLVGSHSIAPGLFGISGKFVGRSSPLLSPGRSNFKKQGGESFWTSKCNYSNVRR